MPIKKYNSLGTPQPGHNQFTPPEYLQPVRRELISPVCKVRQKHIWIFDFYGNKFISLLGKFTVHAEFFFIGLSFSIILFNRRNIWNESQLIVPTHVFSIEGYFAYNTMHKRSLFNFDHH